MSASAQQDMLLEHGPATSAGMHCSPLYLCMSWQHQQVCSDFCNVVFAKNPSLDRSPREVSDVEARRPYDEFMRALYPLCGDRGIIVQLKLDRRVTCTDAAMLQWLELDFGRTPQPDLSELPFVDLMGVNFYANFLRTHSSFGQSGLINLLRRHMRVRCRPETMRQWLGT